MKAENLDFYTTIYNSLVNFLKETNTYEKFMKRCNSENRNIDLISIISNIDNCIVHEELLCQELNYSNSFSNQDERINVYKHIFWIISNLFSSYLYETFDGSYIFNHSRQYLSEAIAEKIYATQFIEDYNKPYISLLFY